MGSYCPLLKKDCIESKCKWWTHILGGDPQVRDKMVDHWDCAIQWIPVLLIENAKEVHQNTALTQEFRNESKGIGQMMIQILASPAEELGETKLISGGNGEQA